MKPSFALSFTEDSIQLLHRSGKAWVVVGETLFAAPDLDDALDYMRRTALGLEPAGITTKLVIPNSQIRYMELEAPGPSEAEREAQIRVALEGKTPYAPEDLVFDWSGKGKLVRVAVLARETLQEAESFAVARKFNPVGFVAIPDYGDFTGEPWFGPTEAAATLLPPGEEVERDKSAIRIQARGGVRAPETGTDAPDPAPAVAYMAADAAPPSAVDDTGFDKADVAKAASPEAAQPEPTPPDSAFAEPRVAFADPAPTPVAEDAPVATRIETQAETALTEAPQATAPAVATAPASVWPEMDTAAAASPPEATKPVAPPEDEPEAPFTHVPDTSAFPEEEDGLLAADPVKPQAGPLREGDPISDPGLDEDLPPPPSQAAMVAFASRRGEGDARLPALGAAARPDPAALARAARGKPVEELPPMPRPPQAGGRPAAATGGLRGAAGKGISALVSTPALAGSRKVKAKPGPLAPPPSPARAAIAAATGPADAAKSLTRPGGTFGNRPPAPARSRVTLFLSLVAILLLCMALVAAWSTFFLASRGDENQALQVAASDISDPSLPDGLPEVEDEMLADGEGDLIDAQPEALPDVALSTEAEGTAVPVAEAAPDTAVPSDSPAAQALDEQQDDIVLATSDTPPPALDALALPTPGTVADVLPDPQMPPPPFGTVYAFDENGLLLPTPEGIVSPEGVMLIAGKPPVVPPARSAAAEAAAAAAAVLPPAEALVDAVPVGEQPEATATIEGATEGAAEAGLDATTAVQPNPELADRRPRARPDGLVVPNPDDAALAPAASPLETPEDNAAVLVTSPRPKERPGAVLAAAESARQQTASASLADPAAADEAEAVLAAAAAAEAANPSVIAISRRPVQRPADFSRAVEAAVAAAIRAPAPEPEPEPVVAAKPKKAAPAPKVEPDEEDEANEPEVAAAPMPKVPTKANVAKQATFKNALNLKKINLIGVYGTQSKRYALIRQANGRYKKVSVGDRFDGGRVEAITQNEVRYQKGGRLVSLKMPKG